MTSSIDAPLWWTATVIVWFLSVLVFLAGLVFVLISILGFIDPVGAKMADDNDPFGPAPTMIDSTLSLLFSLATLLVGLLIPAGYHHYFKKPLSTLPPSKNA